MYNKAKEMISAFEFPLKGIYLFERKGFQALILR